MSHGPSHTKPSKSKEGLSGGADQSNRDAKGRSTSGRGGGDNSVSKSQDAPRIPTRPEDIAAARETKRRAQIRQRNKGLDQFDEALPLQQEFQNKLSQAQLNSTIQSPEFSKNISSEELTILQQLAAKISGLGSSQTQTSQGIVTNDILNRPLVSPQENVQQQIAGGIGLIGTGVGLEGLAAKTLPKATFADVKKAQELGLISKETFGLTAKDLAPDILARLGRSSALSSKELIYKVGSKIAGYGIHTKTAAIVQGLLKHPILTTLITGGYLQNLFAGDFDIAVGKEIDKEIKRTSDPVVRQQLEDLRTETTILQEQFNSQIATYLLPIRTGLSYSKKRQMLKKLEPLRTSISATIMDSKTNNKAISNKIKILREQKKASEDEIDLKYQDRLVSLRSSRELVSGDSQNRFDSQIKKIEQLKIREKAAASQNITLEIIGLITELNNISESEIEDSEDIQNSFFDIF